MNGDVGRKTYDPGHLVVEVDCAYIVEVAM
jgi:hypothetical protein